MHYKQIAIVPFYNLDFKAANSSANPITWRVPGAAYLPSYRWSTRTLTKLGIGLPASMLTPYQSDLLLTLMTHSAKRAQVLRCLTDWQRAMDEKRELTGSEFTNDRFRVTLLPDIISGSGIQELVINQHVLLTEKPTLETADKTGARIETQQKEFFRSLRGEAVDPWRIRWEQLKLLRVSSTRRLLTLPRPALWHTIFGAGTVWGSYLIGQGLKAALDALIQRGIALGLQIPLIQTLAETPWVLGLHAQKYLGLALAAGPGALLYIKVLNPLRLYFADRLAMQASAIKARLERRQKDFVIKEIQGLSPQLLSDVVQKLNPEVSFAEHRQALLTANPSTLDEPCHLRCYHPLELSIRSVGNSLRHFRELKILDPGDTHALANRLAQFLDHAHPRMVAPAMGALAKGRATEHTGAIERRFGQSAELMATRYYLDELLEVDQAEHIVQTAALRALGVLGNADASIKQIFAHIRKCLDQPSGTYRDIHLIYALKAIGLIWERHYEAAHVTDPQYTTLLAIVQNIDLANTEDVQRLAVRALGRIPLAEAADKKRAEVGQCLRQVMDQPELPMLLRLEAASAWVFFSLHQKTASFKEIENRILALAEQETADTRPYYGKLLQSFGSQRASRLSAESIAVADQGFQPDRIKTVVCDGFSAIPTLLEIFQKQGHRVITAADFWKQRDHYIWDEYSAGSQDLILFQADKRAMDLQRARRDLQRYLKGQWVETPVWDLVRGKPATKRFYKLEPGQKLVILCPPGYQQILEPVIQAL